MVTNSGPMSGGQWGSDLVLAQSSFPWCHPSPACTLPYFLEAPTELPGSPQYQQPSPVASEWVPSSCASHPFLPSLQLRSGG